MCLCVCACFGVVSVRGPNRELFVCKQPTNGGIVSIRGSNCNTLQHTATHCNTLQQQCDAPTARCHSLATSMFTCMYIYNIYTVCIYTIYTLACIYTIYTYIHWQRVCLLVCTYTIYNTYMSSGQTMQRTNRSSPFTLESCYTHIHTSKHTL